MRVLLLSTGRRVSLIKRLRKAALQMDVPLEIYGTEIEKSTPSLHFCDQFFIVPPTRSKHFTRAILDLLSAHHIEAILPGNDLDLEFLSDFELPQELDHVKLLFSDPQRTRIFLSKKQSSQFFLEQGLKIPAIFLNPDDVRLPAILKEDAGYGSRGQFVLRDPEDLNANYHKLSEPFLQEFIEGEEYTIDVFSDEEGRPVNILPRLREKVRSGVSDVGRVFLDPDLLEILNSKLTNFRLKGPWNLQCIKSAGDYYFLEVNPRFSGGIPLTIEAGMDFCQNLLEWFFNLEITRFTSVRDGLRMMKYDSELFL